MRFKFLRYNIWAATWQNQPNECAPSEDSDQPGHPPSLISLRCPHEESSGPELPIERTAKTLIRLGGCPGWSVFAVRTVTLLVLSCRGSIIFCTQWPQLFQNCTSLDFLLAMWSPFRVFEDLARSLEFGHLFSVISTRPRHNESYSKLENNVTDLSFSQFYNCNNLQKIIISTSSVILFCW